MNKKGFIADGLLYLISFFVIAFIFLIVGFVSSTMNTGLINALNETEITSEFVTANDSHVINVTDGADNFFNADFLILLLLVGLFIYLVVSFFYIGSNPIFFIVGFIVLIIMIIFSIFFTDFFDGVTSVDNDFSTYVNDDHSLIVNIMSILPIIILVFLAIVLIVMYAKNSGGY